MRSPTSPKSVQKSLFIIQQATDERTSLQVTKKNVAEMNLRRFGKHRLSSVSCGISELAQDFAVLWVAKLTNDVTVQVF